MQVGNHSSSLMALNVGLPCRLENSGHVRNFTLNSVSGRNFKKDSNVRNFRINLKHFLENTMILGRKLKNQ